jgi:alginate O-acetyltransferase complex protein AlgI
MLFNSTQFLFVFFPCVVLGYFAFPYHARWFFLLVASCIFYMAFIPSYILILLVTILIDYFAGIFIEDSQGSVRKFYLIISIFSTCIVLFVFKYFNFFINNVNQIAHFFHLDYSIASMQIILPLGLSFHTFQSLSYVIEVYRGNQKAERHFGIYSLYVMFFPQLVAGPIERPQHLLYQFYEKHDFNYQMASDGLKLMLWGLFKKVVIADRLAILVNEVYNHSFDYYGFPLILATVSFAFQIYCDFSGYSDMAVGSAQVLGFRLMQNFNRPYYSKSISEFWKRWHISLSTWFKDYLYISLGGNQVVMPRWYFNLFFTFLVSGLWHGANWNFMIWGALNGFYLITSLWTEKLRIEIAKVTGLVRHRQLHKYFRILITFSLVCFAWIFFRANSTSSAFYIVDHLFSGFGQFFSDVTNCRLIAAKDYLVQKGLGLSNFELLIAFLSIGIMEAFHMIQRHQRVREFVHKQPILIRWGIYYFIIFWLLFFGVFNQTQFIYFQF